MTVHSYTERTGTTYTEDPFLTGGLRSHLCVRASVADSLIKLDLLAAPDINSVDGKVRIADIPGRYYDRHVLGIHMGNDRIGIRLGGNSVDYTPPIIYEAARALYTHFGGALAMNQTVELAPGTTTRYVRPGTIERYSYSDGLEVPALDSHLQHTDRTLQFNRVYSSEVGIAGLEALLALRHAHPELMQIATSFELHIPTPNITHTHP
ncbi:MAG TPA: hypothetical protein VLI54_04120 [Bacillota bacterium]|nr:hypothetical protein [Bacillota bacterium]